MHTDSRPLYASLLIHLRVVVGSATSQVMAVGQHRKFKAAGDFQLSEDVAEMAFDGLLTDRKLNANFAIAFTVTNGGDNLAFSHGKSRGRVAVGLVERRALPRA